MQILSTSSNHPVEVGCTHVRGVVKGPFDLSRCSVYVAAKQDHLDKTVQ
jgi:hypothetical protein